MKKKAYIAASVIALLGIATSACSSSNKTNTPKKNTSTKVVSQDKNFRKKYDQIEVGELSNHGEGGFSVQQVEDLLGKPSASTESTLMNYKVKSETWTKGSVTITVEFESDKVVSKDITGFKWSGRPEKLNLSAYDNLQNGTSYDEIVKQYGEPDSLNESKMLGKETISAIWLTGVKGESGASVTLTFDNGQLTAKTQSNLS